jgi:hypothetical protein
MASLLHQLLHDVEQRCSYLISELDRVHTTLPPEAQAYRNKMAALLQRAAQHVSTLLNDPGIQHPHFAKNYYYDYKRLAELIQAMEEGPVLALGRFSAEDRMVTMVVQRICDETGYPYDQPLCSAMSAQYYWALTGMDLIFVPCSESLHLLGLADLYHELAHFVLYRRANSLIIPFQQIIDLHFDQAVREGRQKGWTPRSLDALAEYRQRWKRSWYLEFASDVLATYWAGPAYGWANVRLCTNMSSELFSIDAEHPSDDARAKIVGRMLRKTSCDAETGRIDAKWNELLTLTGQIAPQEYTLAYPPKLMDELVDFLFAEFQQAGLIMRQQQNVASGVQVTELLNQAWEEFEARPETFAVFERQKVEELKRVFGIQP